MSVKFLPILGLHKLAEEGSSSPTPFQNESHSVLTAAAWLCNILPSTYPHPPATFEPYVPAKHKPLNQIYI